MPHGGVGFAATSTLGQRCRGQRFGRSSRFSRGTRRRRGLRPQSSVAAISIPMMPSVGAPSHSGNAAVSMRRGSFGGAVVRAQSANGVTRHVRGERLARSPCRLPGFTIPGVTARRSAGCSSVGLFSGIGVGESIARPARPTRKWSRRVRPSCAILSLWRAAHLQRYTDGEERLRIGWHWGGL